MGFISFQRLSLLLFFILLTCYYLSAFRLIHTSPQTHETKVKQEIKESVKKIDEIKDEIMSFKEKFKNQTIKLQHKPSESEDRVKTKIISEKKVKPVQPIVPDIKKEKILRAKSTKFDTTDESSEEEEPKVKPVIPKEQPERRKVIKIEAPKPKDPPIIIKKEEFLKKIGKIPIPPPKEDMIEKKIPKEEKKEETVKLEEEIKIVTIKPKIEKKTVVIKPKEEMKVETIKPKEEKKAGTLKPKEEKKTDTIKPKEEKKVETMKLKEEKKVETIKPKKENKVELKKPKEEKKIEPAKSKKEKKDKKSEPKVEVKSKPKTEERQVTPKQIKESVKKEQVQLAKKDEPKPVRVKKEFNSSISSLYFNLPSFSPNFEIIENEECKKQGHILIDQLKNHKIWALKMFDATAKIPSGILKGNLNQLGDYDQCVGIFTKIPIDDEKEAEVKISGKYCLASIDIEAEIQEMKLPVHLAQSRALIRSKIQDPGHFIPRFTTIRWGLCIPSGCSSEDAERILEDSLKTYNESLNIGINFDVSVDADQCHVRKSPKKLFDYHCTTLATLGLTAIIGLLALVATLLDMRLIKTDTSEEREASKQESGKLEKMLMSFSLKRTVASLLRQNSDPVEIECIHGIRTICTFMLYIAHKLIPVGHLPFTNKTTLTEISNNPLSIILRLSVIYTDSFLLLSGILTSYGMSKDMEEKGRIPWFTRIVARFVRLTPSLLFVLLYYAYVLDILGEGPLWGTVMTSNANLCKENWWRNILYIQNVYPFQEMCATHTHQLALDMQLSLIAPILVWLLYRRPLLGISTTVLLHLISVILRYYATMNYRLSLVIYHGISISQLYRTANILYASSIHRATPYLAGIGLGVLLRQIKPNFYMPKILLLLGWMVAGYFASWALYIPSHLSSRTYKYDINEAAQFAALCSLAWALALSWMIFSCFADKQGFLNSFLSSRPMIILSRISYTLYLTQFIVFFYNVGSIRSSSEFKITSSLDMTELAIVLIISTLLTLLVDMPVQKIKSILFKSAPMSEEPDISSDHIENISNKMEKTTENMKKVTISDTVEILDDNEDLEEEYGYKFRQFSIESEPMSEPLTEDLEEIDDEEMGENLESEPLSDPLTEENEENIDDDEIVEELENKMRQSSFESQPSIEDVEDIVDEEVLEDIDNKTHQSPSERRKEETEENPEDEGAVKFVFRIRPKSFAEIVEDDEEIVKKLENNIRKLSAETKPLSKPDDEE